jgi:hypothetical protein
MKNNRQYIFITIAFIILFNTGIAQNKVNVLDKEIAISAENISAEKIIKEIADRYGMFFAYNPEILPSKKFTLSNSRLKTIKLLRHLLSEDRYNIESFDGQIIISLIESAPIRFEGVLIDRENKSPVPYASIAIMGESVGTISNSDGVFELVIPQRLQNKMITVGCLGYRRTHVNPDSISGINTIELEPFSFRLKEIKVRPVSPEEVLENMHRRIHDNYPHNSILMTSFYRETMQQDKEYIGVWEAVMEMLKSPYRGFTVDKVRYIKGRKSDFGKPAADVKLKIQGGPWYITKLDIIKTKESFIDPDYQNMYKYNFDQPVIYNGRLSWSVSFSRNTDTDFPCFKGYFLVDAETSALVMAKYSLDKKGLKLTGESFIRKQPKGIKTAPTKAEYYVSYRLLNGKWHLHTARTDVRYKVKQRNERFKAEFRSISDLLITQQHRFPVRSKFRGEGIFHSDDIFSELIKEYDPHFWENYNIIKPNDDLINAIKKSLR